MNFKYVPLIFAMTFFVAIVSNRTPVSYKYVYKLKPEESVFAYARISPDGNKLIYASQIKDSKDPDKFIPTDSIVDLKTKKIIWSDKGVDAYWSLDGNKLVYQKFVNGDMINPVPTVRDNTTGDITVDIAPPKLGGYLSWARQDSKDLILTIDSYFFYLDGNKAVLPIQKIPVCEGMGRGERPLISKDGKFVTTFMRGNIVVRSLTDCSFIFDTGLHGAKADFSFDGRYIAFHSQKENKSGYEIKVVDLQEKTVRTVTNFKGSSFFPSWTEDGRLSFRYDGEDYRGFIVASHVLDAPATPLPQAISYLPVDRKWVDIFPETQLPETRFNFVFVWGPWGAYSGIALRDLQKLGSYFKDEGIKFGVVIATDPASIESDVSKILTENKINLRRVPLDQSRLYLTEENNQNPTTLLFRDGVLVDRRLGAQSFYDLKKWAGAFYEDL